MEAAVLPARSGALDAELEVRKLQELVRRLERQNEQLRSRSRESRTAEPPQEEEDEEEEEEPSVLDELELLDLDSLSCFDESDETWLYSTSGSGGSSGHSSGQLLPPLLWCRQALELDSPGSEVEASRRSLSLRLEQVSKWRSSLCSSPSPSPSSSSPGPPPLNRVAGWSPTGSSPSTRRCSSPQPADRPAPSFSSPIHSLLQRSLSPVMKELSPVAERSPTFLPHLASQTRGSRRFSAQSSLDSDVGASLGEDDSLHLEYKLQDLTDVQVMARLQEESLRQDYASTSCRRSQSFTFPLSSLGPGPGLEEEDEEDDEDYGLLPPPQPRLTRLPHSHTFSSTRDWQRSTSSLCTPPSTPCTPPYPTAGFAFQAPPPLPALGLASLFAAEPQGLRAGSDKLRRSMPNLLRAPSMPSVPSSPSASSPFLRNSQSFDSSGALTRLQSSIPPPGALQTRVQSVGNFSSLCSQKPPKATAYVSPTVKGCGSTSLHSLSAIPQLCKPAGGSAPSPPRSALPRPASFVCATSPAPRSKLGQPARSLLTPPKSWSTFSALRDSAWRDGCY